MKPHAGTTVCSEQSKEIDAVDSEEHPAQAHLNPRRDVKKLPHVFYIIDQLCQLGGAERVLLETVRRISRERFRCSVVAFNLNPELKALRNLPGPLYNLPLKRTYDFNAVKMAMQLRHLIRQESVAIVHTFFETSDLWAAPIAKFSGCPILVSSRRDMGILRTRKHRLTYKLANRLFDRVLAVSEEVRGYCIQHDHLSSHRVETLYNGVDMKTLDAQSAESNAREQFGLHPDTPVISTLANIRAIKGIDVLLRSAKQVCIEFPKATFLVVGRALESETMSYLLSQTESLGLANNLRFVGELSNPFPILRASNVFCLPSRSEGFSNALIEAMGCRLPCVATRVGGNAEAIEEGKSGYLVASEDSEAMADSILRLLRDPISGRRMGEAARETVIARFSLDAMMNRLMGIYDELLAAKNV